MSILLDFERKLDEVWHEDDCAEWDLLYNSYTDEEQRELTKELFFLESLRPNFKTEEEAVREADRLIDAGLMPKSVTLPDGTIRPYLEKHGIWTLLG